MGPAGAAITVPRDRTGLAGLAREYKDTARAFEDSQPGPDGDEAETGVALRGAADRSAMALQMFGIVAGGYEA